ncbi:MAG: CARDB domain-containing protein [Pirellulaceae bacterium]|nr:CARDB domain-containing protein [Pirellulaceae bacterium]
MARTTTVVIALLMVVGCVVAMLPAQESSSRRRTSSFRATSDLAPITGPAEGTAPPAAEPGFMPVADEGHGASAPPADIPGPTSVLKRPGREATLSGQLRSTAEAASQDYSGLPPAGDVPAFAPAPDNPQPYQPLETTAPPAASLRPEAAYSPSDLSTRPPVAPPPTTPPANTLPPAIPATTIAAPAETGAMQSILKKPRAETASEAAPIVSAPPTAPLSITAGSENGGSSRRSTSGSIGVPLGSKRSPASLTSSEPRSIQDLALTGRTPALRVDVAGPQAVTVGKPAAYVVSLINEGDSTASDVQLRLALPGFVTVSGSQATSGEAMMHADDSGQPKLVWSVPSVAARGHETLRLQLVATEGQAFDLTVDWACRPATAKGTIAVRQAQLQLSLAGPASMTFGEEKVFSLLVSNPGTGDAENVVVNLAAGEGRAQQIDVGLIPAGQRKEVSVQIVASQAGEMELRAVASGDGGLSAQGAGKVIVRKAELAVAVEGPQLKYAGTEATFVVAVQNSGNAPAENVLVSLALPTGAKFLGGVEGTPSAGTVKWKIPALQPNTEKTYEIGVQLNTAGVNRLVVQAQGPAGIVATGEAQTEVEAAPDLKLVVNDPAGPLPTSEHAVYEVQVMNRGSEAAEQVRIVMQFGDGIEPIAFDGCEAKIVPGQVVCQPLNQLGAGEQVTLRIKARADRGGTHQFRVEVTSIDAGTRLVTEGSTRFFSEASRGSPAANTARKPSQFIPSGTIQR